MGPIYAAGLQGIQRAELQFAVAATNVVAASDGSNARALAVSGDKVVVTNEPPDLVKNIQAMKQSKASVEITTSVLRVTSEMTKRLLDVFA